MSQQQAYIYAIPLSKKLQAFLLKALFPVFKLLRVLIRHLIVLIRGVEAKYHRINFRIWSDDIFIVTYPRSGTTWMQMILYQLFSDGDMNFNHISQRVPWYDMILGTPIHHIKFTSPRVFKTHLRYKNIPKNPCKYIYVVRDGRDIAVSYFHHYQKLMNFKGTFDHFFSLFMKGKVEFGSWFKHVEEWYRNPAGLDILYLRYEEMSKDLPGTLRQVAQFCGVTIDESRFHTIVKQCEFSFMKKHVFKFEPLNEFMVSRNVILGEFVRKGKVGGWSSYFSPEQEKHYDEKFKKLTNSINFKPFPPGNNKK